jgi:hypothetical protein
MELSLVRNTATSKSGDFQIFADRTDSLSVSGMAQIAINMCVRSSFSLTGAYTVGVFGVIISGFVAMVTYYSLYLLIQVAGSTRHPLLEQMWNSAFGPRFALFFPILSVIVAICRVSSITRDVVAGMHWIIARLVSEPPEWILDPVSIAIIAWGAVMVPLSLQNSLRSAVVVSTFCLFLVVLQAGHQIYFFIYMVQTYGFNPEGKLTFIKVSPRLLNAFEASFVAYELAPVSWPGLRHMRCATPRRLARAFGIALLVGFVSRVLLGLIPYLTFYDNISALSMQELFPERIDVLLQCAVKVAIELFSVSLTLNSGRYSLCNVVRESDAIPLEVWTASGAALCLIGAMLAGHGSTCDLIVDTINALGTELLQYIVPPILFIRIFGTKRLLNSMGAVVCILAGCFALACSIYSAVTSE